jgi:hypothetical protein
MPILQQASFILPCVLKEAVKRVPQINSSEERHAIESSALTLKNDALLTLIWLPRLRSYPALSYSLLTPFRSIVLVRTQTAPRKTEECPVLHEASP